MTKDEWIIRCADRYMSAGGAPRETALEFANIFAERQAGLWGESVSEWEGPEDAADEDMSYWEDDGE